MVYVACHPLKDPCLRIPVVAANVEGGIELQQKLFIPMLLISHKIQQSSITEAVKGFFKAWQSSNGFTVKTHMREDVPLIIKN